MKCMLAAILILIMGAHTAHAKIIEPPLAKTFWALFQERNVIGQNDCTNKSGRYLRELIKNGYKADIVIILPHRSRFSHAIIELKDNDDVIYLDPTKGLICRDLGLIGVFQKSIPYAKLESFGEQYK